MEKIEGYPDENLLGQAVARDGRRQHFPPAVLRRLCRGLGFRVYGLGFHIFGRRALGLNPKPCVAVRAHYLGQCVNVYVYVNVCVCKHVCAEAKSLNPQASLKLSPTQPRTHEITHAHTNARPPTYPPLHM